MTPPLGCPTGDYTLADIWQASHVTRWHSINCQRYPSIAEHSFLVMMMASRLYRLIETHPQPEDELALMKMGAWHDMPEVITGDIPTPIKRWLERHFAAGSNPLEALERQICPEYRDVSDALHARGEALYLIFKMGDVADAYRFIRLEGKGDVKTKIASERIATLGRMRRRLEMLYEARAMAGEDVMARFHRGMETFFRELDDERVKELDFVEVIQGLDADTAREFAERERQ